MSLPGTSHVIRELLLEAKKSAVVLKQLYALKKAEDVQVTYKYLCRVTGVPSAGYWSDVVNGRRNLAERHVDAVSRFFKISGLEAKFFRALINKDRKVSYESRKANRQRYDELKKLLRVSVAETTPFLEDSSLLAIKIFCMFSLFHPRAPTLADFIGALPEQDPDAVRAAVSYLKKERYIREIDGRLTVDKTAWLFLDRADDKFMENFVRRCLKDAQEKLPLWYRRPDLAHFQSTILSTNQEKITPAIKALKEKLFIEATKLETKKSDAVVHLNLQIYPTYLSS